MSIRLVRKSSETPNIQNKDDVRMIRYAYGYDGYIKGYGEELAYAYSNRIFKILSGRIVFQGWEIDIDAEGWNLDLSNSSGTQYYSVYLELDISIESATIQGSYSLSSYPNITAGEDLTTIPNGKARLLLYQFKIVSGSIAEITKNISELPYLSDFITKSQIPIFKGSANYVNNVEIKKEKNVLKADSDIVSRKRLLFKNKVNIAGQHVNNPVTIFSHTTSLAGKKLEVEISSLNDSGDIVSSQSFVLSCQDKGYTSVQYIADNEASSNGNGVIAAGRIIIGVNGNSLWGVSYRRNLYIVESADINGNPYTTVSISDSMGLARAVTMVYEIIE
jgi:lipopolysaccharide export system protein LptA